VTATRTPATIRAELHAALEARRRGARNRRQIEALEWELDRATTAQAINVQRAARGLEPLPDAHAEH
jgi:hypothetical protein